MQKIKQMWTSFAERNPKLSDWVREGGLFFLVSNLITIIRGILITVLEPAFDFLGTAPIGFPNWELTIFGVTFNWYIIGASSTAYFAAFMISLWVCEIINFFLQRKFVFRSNGKMGRQATLYFLAFLIVTCIVNAISNLWIGVASSFVSPFIYNLGTTILTGGVAMVVFFFANRYIFKENKGTSGSSEE
jgi:putative flippase GtrA